ncbi:hypothetical protein CR513_07291, partial [Mucuna pruriens]
MAKQKYLMGKLRKHYKRWRILAERIGVDSLRMRSGHTQQHTKLRWGCLPTGLSLAKPATCRLNWNIELTSSIPDRMDHLLSLMFFPMVQLNIKMKLQTTPSRPSEGRLNPLRSISVQEKLSRLDQLLLGPDRVVEFIILSIPIAFHLLTLAPLVVHHASVLRLSRSRRCRLGIGKPESETECSLTPSRLFVSKSTLSRDRVKSASTETGSDQSLPRASRHSTLGIRPNLEKEEEKEKKKSFIKKKKILITTWEELDLSSLEDADKETNLCLMVDTTSKDVDDEELPTTITNGSCTVPPKMTREHERRYPLERAVKADGSNPPGQSFSSNST